MTGTDKTRLEIVLSQIVAAFSEYCAEPFTVEPLKVVSEHNGETRITPEMTPRVMQAEIPYIKSCLGLDLSADDIIKLLAKMSLQASKTSNPDVLDVAIPPPDPTFCISAISWRTLPLVTASTVCLRPSP